MSIANLWQNLPSLASLAEPLFWSIVDRQPLTVDPQMLLVEVVDLISQARADLEIAPTTSRHHGVVLVVAADRLVGILTAGDLVKLTANQVNLQGITVGEVMSATPIVLVRSDRPSAMAALTICQQHQIRHLPILDDRQQLVGMVALADIRQIVLEAIARLQQPEIEPAAELERIDRQLLPATISSQQVETELERRVRERTAALEGQVRQLQAEIVQQQYQPAERSLQQSERKFRAIFNGTFQFIGLLDTAGIVLEANQTALAAIGATADEIVGQVFWETPWWTHSPDLQIRLQQSVTQAATGELVRFEAKHFLADGSFVIVDFSLSPIFDETGAVVMLIPEGRDITERKRMETALQESQARYLALLTSAPVGIFQTDRFGNCIFVNQQWSQLTGLSLAAAAGEGWMNALHPHDRARVAAEWDRAVRAKREFTLEYRFMTPQGQVNWVEGNAIAIHDEAGNMTGYLGTLNNITERKAAAQQIQEQAALLEIATDAIVVRDLDSRIRFWNQGAATIYGWSADEAIDRTTAQLFYPDRSPELTVETAFRTVLDRGWWQGELTKTTKAGKKVTVESRWTLVRDESGNPRSILSVDTDITEKKLLEQQFLRAQRLESLGSLASGIAHDLNNVLTPIVGAAQLLPLTLPNLDDRNRRLLNMLVESSKRGSGLVKQILSFARGMDGERTVLQVRHILDEIASVARQTFPKSMSIGLQGHEDLWLVNVDPTQIHQVLMNLFVNARDAMPDGGQIVATAANIAIDAEYVKLHLQPPVGAYVLVTVTDTGSGMTEEVRDRIFEPFFTTKTTGTGLGLSTVLGIIKAHGGAIEVESEVGRGTCFKIYLPAIVPHRDSTADLQATDPVLGAQSYDGRGQLVLVVDDEAAIRNTIAESLAAYNYRTILASDGIEAIDIYAQNHHSLAIVLIDLMMPNLDTRSTIQALQEIDATVKIVVMSGLDPDLEALGNANRSRIDRQMPIAFLSKPFTTIEMLQILAP